MVLSQSLPDDFFAESFLSQPLLIFLAQQDLGVSRFAASWQLTSNGWATRKSINMESMYAAGFMRDEDIDPANLSVAVHHFCDFNHDSGWNHTG